MSFIESWPKWLAPLPILLGVLLLSGCKTASGVGMRMILPPSVPVMDIPKDEVFLMASPVSQPMPAFPAGAPRAANVAVCVEIVVDEHGAVSSAAPIYGLPDCPLGQVEIDRRFVASSIKAVKSWQFLAAAICSYPDGVPQREDCSGAGVVVSPVAIKLSYVFSFEGSGRVTALAKRS